MRTLRRRAGNSLMVIGVLLIAYAIAVVFWRDPVTDVYTIYQQHQLSGKLDHDEKEYLAIAKVDETQFASDTGEAANAAARTEVARLAHRFGKAKHGKLGAPIGTINAKRIDLGTILVEGTDYWSSLSKGPGHYGTTEWPGEGKTVGIAGHRTTFSAPFRHIDDFKKGDLIVLKMPYGTFRYEVTHHRIVKNNDWSIIRDAGYEQLVISACHPLYSASHRWVVFARLASFSLPGSRASIPAQA
jgi:sortase A